MEANRNLMQKAVGPRVVGIVLSTVFALTLLLEWGAYEAGVRAEARATAPRALPANYCVKCHSDSKTLRMMILKEDNNGTASYCAGVKLPSQQEMDKLAKDEARSIRAHKAAPRWPSASK